MRAMARTTTLLVISVVASLAMPAAEAAPKQLKPSGKVTADEGMLSEAFALDESGSKVATIRFTARGSVQLQVGAPGGKPQVADISSFSATPEQILGLG